MKKSAHLMVGILVVFALMVLASPKAASAGEFAPQPEPPSPKQQNTEQWTITAIQGSSIVAKSSAGQTKIIQTNIPSGIKIGDKLLMQGNAIQQWIPTMQK